MANYQRPTWILLAALVLGWSSDFFFYGQSLGVSALLFVSLLLIALFGLGQAEGIWPRARNLWLLVPLLFFATMIFIRANAFLTFLNVMITLGLLGLVAHYYAAGRIDRTGLLGYPLILLEMGLNTLTRPGPVVGASVNMTAVREQGQRNVMPVVRGFALAIPILALFTCFLASADLVFASYVEQALDLDFLPDLFEGVWRGLIILVMAWLIAGGLTYAYSRRFGPSQTPMEKAAQRIGPWTLLGAIESSILLIAIDLLFLIFVWIQFTYLFGGQSNITIEGFTYADYARKGFFELVAVSVMSLGLILGLQRLGHRTTPGHVTLFKGLSTLMVGLVIVLLVSAFQRLMLYEAAFGYTQLRLYSHVFMVWLAATFVWFVGTLWLQPSRFAIGAFVATLGFVITLNVINPDAFIARQNLARYQSISLPDSIENSGVNLSSSSRGYPGLDTPYLTTLSDDAVPVLVSAVEELSPEDQEFLRHHLDDRASRLERSLAEQPWYAFHLSSYKAYSLLAAHDLN